jgi:hypothetical protein
MNGKLTDLVPELGAPKHLDRDRALQRLRALLTSASSTAPAPANATAPTTTTTTRLATTHDEHTPAAITTPVERPRLTTCTFADRDELAAFELAVEGPHLLGCSPPPGEEAAARGGSPGWERRLGGLCAARAMVEARGAASEAFEDRLLERALAVLEDGEVRVRQAAGGLLAALAAAKGVGVLDAALGPLLDSIRRNFDREGEEEDQHGAGDAPHQPTIREGDEEEEGEGVGEEAAQASNGNPANAQQPPPPDLLSSLLTSAYKPVPPGTGEMRHGTEGWKALETSVRALQQVVDALPPEDVAPRLSAPVRSVLYGSLSHPNRFVRETGHFMLASASAALKGPALEEAADELAPRIADGLSDNWSQVRYAACVGARAFMAALGGLDGGVLMACGDGEGKSSSGSSSEVLRRVVPVLLPPMCLNRYYVAAGVRLYAQASWRLLVGASAAEEEEEEEEGAKNASSSSAGRAAVAAHCPSVVSYYVSQSKANNHAVREAACACMAELMEKVDRRAVAPHVPTLLNALRTCFRDSSWPVRDAACTALGRCVLAYPSETRASVLGDLYALWAAHLWDNIPTVRENSAAALGRALRAYGADGGEVVASSALAASSAAAASSSSSSSAVDTGGGSGGAASRCAALLRDLLPRALEQPEESARYSGLENTTTFGVAARKAKDNDPAVHTGQDLFSCGSLSARFSTSRLVRSDGCMDHGFSRGRQPWEASDGAVHLLREYSAWWGGLGLSVEGGGGGGGGEASASAAGSAAASKDAALADPIEYLPHLLRLARLDTFQHAANLRETVWKCLPDIAKGVGARRFKAPLGGGNGELDAAGDEGGWLALFAQAAADDLKCGHQLAAAAAGRALAALRDAFGGRIVAARLRDDEQRRALAGGDPNVPLPAPRTPGLNGSGVSGGAGGGAGSSLLFRNNDALLAAARPASAGNGNGAAGNGHH